MTKLEYVVNDVCEGDRWACGTDEDIMKFCPSDFFMPAGDICKGKEVSLDCKRCWNAEKQEETI